MRYVERRDGLEFSAADRSNWPVRRFPLGQEPPEDLSEQTTATERIAMMWPLAQEAWKLAGLPIPEGPIAKLPSRILREGRTE